MKSSLDPAATPGEPHSSASPQPTSRRPNNHEQPTNPHRVTLVSTPGPPTSSPMKEPPTPRPPNSRKYQKYMIRNPKFWPRTRRNWLGLITPHPIPSVIDTPEHTKAPLETYPLTDATLQNTTPTRTNYAVRTNLASPNPANEEGPAALATSAGIRARPWGDLHYPPANCTARTTKAPNPLGTVKDSKVHPPIPVQRTSPPQTKNTPTPLVGNSENQPQ
ncbi:hypothetical protein E4T56_gene20797 [Termitomyces sp. T112]|nr:hypothetical protein E4T56_gene20797 [Termitomyces sp. T112]